jgi:hypothetical protein
MRHADEVHFTPLATTDVDVGDVVVVDVVDVVAGTVDVVVDNAVVVVAAGVAKAMAALLITAP